MFGLGGSRAGRSQRAGANIGFVPLVTQAVLQANASRTNNDFSSQSWAAADIVRDDVFAWTATSPTRFTTPGDFRFARLTGFAAWASSTAGARWLYGNINGAQMGWGAMHTAALANENFTPVIGRWIDIRPGDYFDFVFAQSSGGALNLTGSSARNGIASFIQIEWAR